MNPDFFNGLFEFVGAFMILANIKAILRDKTVKGVSWQVTGFFTVWGAWNLYYYPHLDQWWSFTGGLMIFAANAVWVALAIYYLMELDEIG